MSPCPSHRYDYEPLLETVQATTITTIIRPSPPSQERKRPAHATTLEKIIFNVSVEIEYVSAGAQMGTDRGFATPTFIGPASTSMPVSTILFPSVSSMPLASESKLSTSASAAITPSSQEPAGFSSTASSSSTDLKAVSGAKATIGTAANEGSSPSVPVGAILGVVIAGVLVVALVVLLLVLWGKRRSARAAQNADATYYDGGMREAAPVTPYPADLQPNRADGGGRTQTWMLCNSHLAGVDQPGAAETYSPYPNLVANPQYPFAPPVALGSPQRPTRQRGDTLSSAGFF
ncbi:hypothetical protein DFH09DRAFT_212567 [Mycena vulgaris]|nr:hypothetical protein DFH09DRAFT_212567 [Mycena vulgaris]